MCLVGTMHLKIYFLGDTLHLSDIDMIAGTPVLDVKPYIPEYDSPHTRKGLGLESYNLQTTPMSLNEKPSVLTLQKDSETNALSDLKSEGTADEDSEDRLAGDMSEAGVPNSSQVSVQLSLHKHLHSVLEDVKAYVNQEGCESEDPVPVSPKTEALDSAADHPSFGEEAYSAIAGWIREPSVGSLEVRFTPHAERQLAQFLPSHLSGKLHLYYVIIRKG